METKMKIGLFIIFFGYMILGLLIDIPPRINNIIYGGMSVFAIVFVFKNKEKMGLNDIFKKKEEDEKN